MAKKKKLEIHPGYALEYWKLVAFFKDDPTIEVSKVNDDTKSCTISCDDALKVLYLKKLIYPEYLTVDIICNKEFDEVSEEMIDYVCQDNPHYAELYNDGYDKLTVKAALFKADCMHYFSDDMFSPTGHTAVTARDLAAMVFNDGLNFQTKFEA